MAAKRFIYIIYIYIHTHCAFIYTYIYMYPIISKSIYRYIIHIQISSRSPVPYPPKKNKNKEGHFFGFFQSTVRHVGANPEGLQHKHHIMLPPTPSFTKRHLLQQMWVNTKRTRFGPSSQCLKMHLQKMRCRNKHHQQRLPRTQKMLLRWVRRKTRFGPSGSFWLALASGFCF